ncbi:FAST kinase domain-containing protein 3, mitochondrial [Trichoplax sp. H2]|nr:FAST kinase domain-containing protein 3, mitochondrial [Trichoplax sp. H2]|eukprot:RDD42824.1 FAST kinase domain-containing protein 3, mitochondrial [Trichoplax sp. H2]
MWLSYCKQAIHRPQVCYLLAIRRSLVQQSTTGDSSIYINREIIGCNSVSELLGVTKAHLPGFDNINIITAFDRVSRLSLYYERKKLCNDRIFARLCQAVTVRSETMTGLNYAHLAWSLAKGRFKCQNWQYLDMLQAVRTGLESNIEMLPIQKLALVSWSVANYPKLKSDVIVDKLIKTITLRSHKLATGHDINQLYHAFAKLGYQDSKFYDLIDTQAEENLALFKIQEAAGLYHSLSILGRENTRLWSKLTLYIKFHANKLDGKGIANVTWSLANIGNKDDAFLQILGNAAMERIKFMNPDSLAIFAWSLVSLDYFDDKLFDVIADESLVQMRKFSAQNLSNLLLAFAKSNYMIPKLFHDVAESTIKKLHNMEPQAMANIALSYAKVSYYEPNLVKAFTDKVIFSRMKDWHLRDLADLMYFFAKMNSCDSKLLEKFNKVNLTDWLKGSPPARFTSHELIIRIVWSLIVLNRQPRNIVAAVMNPQFLKEATTACGGALPNETQCQLHQIALSIGSIDEYGSQDPQLLCNYLNKYRKTFNTTSQSSLTSSYSFHVDVTAALESIVSPEYLESEFITPYGYSTDLYFETDLSGKPIPIEKAQTTTELYTPLAKNNRLRYIVEVDGKTHFLRKYQLYTGPSILKKNHLKKFGYNVIQIPHFEWRIIDSFSDKVEYLRRKISHYDSGDSVN